MSLLPSSRATTAFPGSIAVSVILHGTALVILAQLSAPSLPPLATIIPVSLVSLPGGGGGPKGEDIGPPPGPVVAAAPVAPPPAAPAPTPTRVAKAAPKPVARVTKPAPAPTPAAEPAPAVADASLGAGSAGAAGSEASGGGGGGSGGGGGDGSGGDGSGGARVAYGQNPLPPYPVVARRLGMEGVVLLDVLVAPDGSAADVRLARSSGHQQLDDSAVRTVRERWRFIPARRNGAAVESRVTVPIRFRLSGQVEAAG
jgi:periplasmic protein TonB